MNLLNASETMQPLVCWDVAPNTTHALSRFHWMTSPYQHPISEKVAQSLDWDLVTSMRRRGEGEGGEWVIGHNLSLGGMPFSGRQSFTDSARCIALKAATSLPNKLNQSILDLSKLEKNWDGEGAEQIKSSVLADVVVTLQRLIDRTKSLQEPFLVPTFDGYVQIEWHGRQRMLDLEAVEGGWVAVGILIDSENKRHYFTAESERNDFERVWSYYEWWAGTLLWPL